MKNLNQFSDSELYSICKKWGREALVARRRFAGLLPEVNRREMATRAPDQLIITITQKPFRKSWLERRGFTCIYEFAARLAGMSRDQVNRVLQLNKRFSTLPILHDALINGDVSINKLARIASVATVDNQRELLDKAEKLSKAALEIYIKEYKATCGDLEEERVEFAYMNMVRAGESVLPDEQIAVMNVARTGMSAVPDEQNTGVNLESAEQGGGQIALSLFEQDVLSKPSSAVPTARAGSVPRRQGGVCDGHRFGDTETKGNGLQLDKDVTKELQELHSKGIDVNEFLRKCLEQRKLEIAREKEKLAEEANRDRKDKFLIGKPASGHIPSRIRKIIVKEHGTKCSAPHCGKPASHIHHQKRFASFGSHDPHHLRLLCKAHHELRHADGGLRYVDGGHRHADDATLRGLFAVR